MFGGEAARSAAEHGLLKAADTGTTDAGIRSDVGDPATATVNKGTTTRDIIAAPEGDGQYARTVTPQQSIYLRTRSALDRKSAVQGKSIYVGVHIGVTRLIKQKQCINKT